MDNRMNRMACTLFLMSAILTAARYIAAAVMTGTNVREVYEASLDILGPFLPTMAIICLAGGAILIIADQVLAYKNRDK